MSPWVSRLLIANLLVFVLQISNPMLTMQFAYTPSALVTAPWTVITYMFLHGGFGHLFFNMLGLWIFGPRVEARLGSGRFIVLYMVAGLIGALTHTLFTPFGFLIGASGAVYGVTYAFARFWPREPIYLWGVLRLEAWTLVLLLTAISILNGVGGGGDTAHFAHLGGFLGGYLFVRWAETTSDAAKWKARVAPATPPPPLIDINRWKRLDLASLHPVNREEYERVLAKLEAAGVHGLSSSEIEFMERFSRITT
jgi:membrane associated rhomboid family serine protease